MCPTTSRNDRTWSDTNFLFIAHHWLEDWWILWLSIPVIECDCIFMQLKPESVIWYHTCTLWPAPFLPLSKECRGACDIDRDSIDVDSSQHNGPPRCWYADICEVPMPVNKFQGAKLLCSLQLEHHRSEEPEGPGPVCLCRAPVTSTSCRSKFHTWPFLERQLFLWCCITTGAHASTRNSGHSNARTAAHLLPAILSDRGIVWSVTWNFHSDFFHWPTIIIVSAILFLSNLGFPTYRFLLPDACKRIHSWPVKFHGCVIHCQLFCSTGWDWRPWAEEWSSGRAG